MEPLQRIRPMTTADLEMVLAWRNHPEVRRYMYTTHEIALEEHRLWFDRVSRDPQRHILVFEDKATALGFISIQQVAFGVADWGFYAAPSAPKGTGHALGDLALRYAFDTVGLHKMCGQAIAFNERSIRFHRILGFSLEGTLRHQHYDGNYYHDVLCFGLLEEEWREQRSEKIP